MARKIIQRYLPENGKITNNRSLRLLGPVIFNPLLWHLHRRSFAKAVAIGLFCALLPLPIQMLLAAIGAIIFQANLPVAVVLVWASNPITTVPLLIFTYKVGTWVLGKPAHQVNFSISFHWLMKEIAVVWQPLLLGSLICAVVAAILGYIAARIFWRCWVVYHWRKRARIRAG